jgi:pyruvate/2-oxoglutarate dehydrogenase complex dihydrolipoamide acyltransferase (E2) component
VTGTGPGGRVVAADVRAAADRPVEPAADRPAQPAGIDRTAQPAGTVNGLPSPLVRRDAQTLGIDLGAVAGTGPGGRVTRDDVRRAATVPDPAAAEPDPATAQPAAQPPGGVAQVVPLTGMRGAIATRMVASLHEMAQLTHGFEVRMDAAVRLRDRLRLEWGEAGLPVPSLNDLVVRAAALALREHPRLNASVVGPEIHVHADVHVGLAVAVPDGLLVPVIRHADRLGLDRLATTTRDLATRARAGRLGLADLTGGTFAVTSLGTYGVDFFTPVINPGNVAILGVGRLRDGVAWIGGGDGADGEERPVRTQVLTLSLTFDHRAVDGAPAAEYLQAVRRLLERPLLLLASP